MTRCGDCTFYMESQEPGFGWCHCKAPAPIMAMGPGKYEVRRPYMADDDGCGEGETRRTTVCDAQDHSTEEDHVRCPTCNPVGVVMEPPLTFTCRYCGEAIGNERMDDFCQYSGGCHRS